MAYSDDPFPPTLLCQIALSGALDEISNIPGAVRSHIFWHGRRHSVTGKLQKAMMFFVYQTTRKAHGMGFVFVLFMKDFTSSLSPSVKMKKKAKRTISID